jgi:hypothetical protein
VAEAQEKVSVIVNWPLEFVVTVLAISGAAAEAVPAVPTV